VAAQSQETQLVLSVSRSQSSGLRDFLGHKIDLGINGFSLTGTGSRRSVRQKLLEEAAITG
jgi:hypothetical protein